MQRPSFSHQPAHRQFLYLAIGYGVLLVYGTLFPLNHFQAPLESPFSLMLQHDLQHASRADIVTNLLVYMPFGLFLLKAFQRRDCPACRIFLAVTLATLLSLLLEYLQAHLPGRVPSVADLVLNSAGALIGALIALLVEPEAFLGDRLRYLRGRFIVPGHLASFGLGVLGFWALSQLSPLVPSLDLGNLRHGLKPLYHTLLDPSRLKWLRVVEYGLSIGALGILAGTLQRTRFHAVRRFTWLVVVILLLKVPVVTRQLSLEAIAGLVIGVFITLLALSLPLRQRTSIALLALVGAVLAAGLYAPPGGDQIASAPFNWIPFRAHLTHNVRGIVDILGGLWPYLAFSYIALAREGSGRHRFRVALWGAIFIFLATFLLEWHQRTVPGRSADITDAILPVLAWLLPWLYSPFLAAAKTNAAEDAPRRRRPATPHRKWPLVAGILVLLATGALVGSLYSESQKLPDEQARRPLLPPPEQAAATNLPKFDYGHPRLPAPTQEQITLIREHNPKYLSALKGRADGGKGKLYPAILMAHIDPDSQDLDLLYRRLMGLKLSWRGHLQAKPLALAYDWLYHQWSPEQRMQLRRKVIRASNYLIDYIRVKQRLSPYNVYLYNSPLQALMATTLATYGDGPGATLPMNWLNDYWKRRVLPVWRQVMGENGGWHEGGEYVGIGIGQAVYQLPALWRKATGEDLFRTEPGIRGFLDFLIYRTRPDGTHMRWGDSAYFDARVPGRIPLAIEFQDSLAYSLRGCPRPYEPSSWPWGPLTSNALCTPEIDNWRPLEHLFDGIGMVVARSSWKRDATYLSFKAGDNFWSHSHLDQGAFTLFKGGPLAIDSGLYGPKYGADHHMNYSYQAIAHNLLTVTDPADDRPQPAKKKKKKQTPRQIANDGGQRRIGSGWGVESAPLDLAEWLRKREIYHTGAIAKYHAGNDLVVAVAELTPAYTNSYSGLGTFSHRTRRVERYWRTLIYDRRNDVVVVYDDLVSSDPTFLKRSLFHTMGEPRRTLDGFVVRTPESRRPKRPAGHLKATVLFPEYPGINIVGGKGSEFLVNGVNYDEGGGVWRKVAQRKKNPPEPGLWRVEITPPMAQQRDRFLMLLEPGIEGTPRPGLRIERLARGNSIGSRISGPQRTIELLFPADREGVVISLLTPGEQREIDLTLVRAEPAPPTGWWQQLKRLLGL